MNARVNYDARIKELMEVYQAGCISFRAYQDQAWEYWLEFKRAR